MDYSAFAKCCALRKLLPLTLLAAIPLSLQAAEDSGASRAAASTKVVASGSVDSLDARLGDLIKQLGSPQFTVRRAAANEIRRIGPEAFDKLHAATENSDPEIAASASYLMRQIAVRAPSYAATASDCFKNTIEHASIVPITNSTMIGKQTANSVAATPRRRDR